MMNNRINIEFLRGQMDKVLTDIEALKDKNREMYYTETEWKHNDSCGRIINVCVGDIKEALIQDNMAACL